MKFLLLTIPTVLAFLFSVVLFFKGQNKRPLKILSCYFLLFFIVLLDLLVLTNEAWKEHSIVNALSLLFFVALIAIPPTMYSYTISLSDGLKKEKMLNHYYLPLVLLVINLFSFVYLTINEDETSYLYDICHNVMSFANGAALLFIFPLLNVFYIFKTSLFYKRHKEKIGEVFSYEEGVNLKWMKTFIIGYVLFIFCVYFLYGSSIISVYIPITLFLIGYFVFIGVKGYQQKMVSFKEGSSEQQSIEEIHIEDVRLEYKVVDQEEKNSLLDTDKLNQLKIQVLEVMKSEEPFLNPKLTVHELAKMSNTNSKYLSNLLNSVFEQNFVSFINGYRIEKSKELLLSNEHKNLTIEGIAQLSGFNSKSAFNNAFKNLVGQTPSSFKKQSV